MAERRRALLLGAIALGALALRLSHQWRWALWGSDSGEYLFLSAALVGDGTLLQDGYLGWGRAYSWFQGMQILAASAALLCGTPLPATLFWFIPAAGALAVPALFLAGRRFVSSDAALVGCGCYAVAFPVVFANSHAMPGGLADPLGLLLVYAFVGLMAAPRRWAPPFGVLLLGLLLVHHFTLLLAIAGCTGMLTLEAAAGSRRRAGYFALATAAALTALYWVGYAAGFRTAILGDTGLPLGALLAAPLVTLGVVRLLAPRLPLPALRAPRRPARLFLGAFLASLLVIGYGILRGVPGTAIPVGPEAVPFLLPPLGWLALAAAPGLVLAQRTGWLLYGWALPIVGLAAIGGLTGSHLLIAYRHAPYLMAPLALMAGAGFVALLRSRPGAQRPQFAAGLAAILLCGALTAYPPAAVMGGFQEGTTNAELGCVLWVRQVEPAALVVSDHRLSSLAFGLGERNASWERGAEVLTATGVVREVGTPAAGTQPVGYVLLSDEVRAGVALLQWEAAQPLSPEAAAKFGSASYPAVYDSGVCQLYRQAPVPLI